MKKRNKIIITLSCVGCLLLTGGIIALSSIQNSNKEDESSSPLVIKNNNIKSEKLSDTEYKLIATVYPEYNFNKSVEWTMAFKNPNSEWSNGKNVEDYLGISVDSNDLTVCTIKLKQAFGEQIVITCSSTNYPDIKASCTIDYEKKIVSSSLYINYGLSGVNAYINEGDYVKSSYTVEYSPTYSLDKEYSNLKLNVDIYPENGEPGINTIPYDSTGKTINYSCVVRYLTSLLNNSTTFSTTTLMNNIKNDDEADIFLGNEYIMEKELYVAHLKNQNFIFRGRLYEGEKLLFTNTQSLKLKLKDVTSISLSNSTIIF